MFTHITLHFELQQGFSTLAVKVLFPAEFSSNPDNLFYCLWMTLPLTLRLSNYSTNTYGLGHLKTHAHATGV